MSIQNPFMKIVNTYNTIQLSNQSHKPFHIGCLESSQWYNFQGLALYSRQKEEENICCHKNIP